MNNMSKHLFKNGVLYNISQVGFEMVLHIFMALNTIENCYISFWLMMENFYMKDGQPPLDALQSFTENTIFLNP